MHPGFFFSFLNLSTALYEHKQVLRISVRVETTKSCVLDVIKSININLVNYNRLYFEFCAKSTKIVVLGIATRRWRCRTSHRSEIMADLDWTSRYDTGKFYNVYVTNIRTLVRDLYVETLISVGTTWALSNVRSRVPCGCTTSGIAMGSRSILGGPYLRVYSVECVYCLFRLYIHRKRLKGAYGV